MTLPRIGTGETGGVGWAVRVKSGAERVNVWVRILVPSAPVTRILGHTPIRSLESWRYRVVLGADVRAPFL